jgi:uncharacterized membrane protein
MTIRNPVEWGADQMALAAQAVRSASNAFGYAETTADGSQPRVRRISLDDLKDVLVRGFQDYGAYRTDVLFICVIYPLAGLFLAQFALSYGALPLIFPLVSGFALIGPFAAAGLYEMSRRQEQGKPISWADAFGVFGSPSFAAIIKLGLLLLLLFALWLAAAMGIYMLTLGPDMPTSVGAFISDIFTTPAGWAMIVVGIAVGAVFAFVALSISVVSFPLLLDRPVSVWTAISTSIRAVMLNPVPMLAWGAIVTASLVIGAIPALIGLIVVMPVLGHATWHLYRKAVAPRGG